jgi:hypothetical protein
MGRLELVGPLEISYNSLYFVYIGVVVFGLRDGYRIHLSGVREGVL